MPPAKHLTSGFTSTLAVLLLAALAAADATAASLRAGVGVESITSDSPTKPIHDPLLAKALVVDDGKTRAALVCLDLIGASEPLTAAVRRQVYEELKIAQPNILVNASHNHHTNGQVASDVVPRIVRAVHRAVDSMAPVKAGAGAGREDRITINRRLRMKDGTHWTIRRATPSPKDAAVAGLGPLDPEIGILRLDRMDGTPLVVVYNFACHAYGGVPGGEATADLPGFASRVIEEAWPSATAMFLQGAAGDVTPIRYKDFDAPAPTEQLGVRLGLSTLRAAQGLSLTQEAAVRVEGGVLDLPRRTDVQARIDSLLAQQEEILQFFTGLGCGTHGAGTPLSFKSFLPLYMKHLADPEHPAYASYLYEFEAATGQTGLEELDAANRKRIDNYLECIGRMEKLIVVRTNLQMFQQHLKQAGAGPLRAEIQGMRIGSFVLVTFPGEPFAEVGLRIKKQSPFPHTFVAGYSNGSVGYAPTADAYDKEAYEDALAQLAPEWQESYETKALELVRRLAD